MLLIYRNLRRRPARTLFTALAIALGVGMIFAMRIVGVAIEESARASRESSLAGADLEVTSAAGARFLVAVADTIAANADVEKAAPIQRGQEGVVEANAQ